VATFVRTAVVWAALGGVLAAQAPGTLKGVVVDASGGAIPGARVTLRDQAGSVIRSATADAGGRFVMDAPASTYLLVAESDLFETRREGVRLSEGGVHEIRLVLAVAGLAEKPRRDRAAGGEPPE
jgi:hypothetical protein